MKTGQKLYQKAKRIIPGGTQLLSKRPELFLPEQWPTYYTRAKGVEVWDLDGKKYIDMTNCGIGATVLGFADSDVDKAVKDAIDAGQMTTLNCPEEIELAELLCELHPWAHMVRYARTGGESMAIAIRIARAHTRRDKFAFCGYHGWHDWYLAANLGEGDVLDGHLLPGLEPVGVPRCLAGTALPFQYNCLDELKEIVSNHRDELAAIVMEPIRDHEPAPGFLEEVRNIATEIGAVFIFDEITVGWRLNTGGVHLLYNVIPDIAVFAKALSNGYPMAAIIGTEDVMQAAQNTFISSTYWTERIGPVAALATIRKHQRCQVPKRLIEIGRRIQGGWQAAAESSELVISVTGIPPLSYFTFEGYPQSQAMVTLFNQMMLDQGFLTKNAFYATYAHQLQHVNSYMVAVNESFVGIAKAVRENTVEQLLKGPISHTGFRRLT